MIVLLNVRSSFLLLFDHFFTSFSVIIIITIMKVINRMNCIIKEVIEIPNIMSNIVHTIPKGKTNS